MSKYAAVVQMNDTFIPVENRSTLDKIPPGSYQLEYDYDRDQLIIEAQKFTHDEILDIPSPEFQRVIQEMEMFLNGDTKQKFDDYGFLYKRSALLHGVPGTGKTVIVNRIAREVIKNGGIVLFNPHPDILAKGMKAFDDLQPESTVLVVFEELDELISEHREKPFLNLLDGEIQKNNVMYLATTNHIENINPRIYRPGRFASLIEVQFPNEQCREFYLAQKLGDPMEAKVWAKKTEGLSIDELKEVVLSVKCFGNSIDGTVDKILNTKRGNDYKKWKADQDRKNNPLTVLAESMSIRRG